MRNNSGLPQTGQGADVEIKLSQIRLYGSSTGEIGASIYDPTDPDANIIQTLFDRSNGVNLPSVGYQLPARIADNVLNGTTEAGRTIVATNGTASGISGRFYLTWRVRG